MIAAILLALGIMTIWSGATFFSFLFTRDKDLTLLMGVTLGVWVLKFLLVFGVFWVLKPYDFYDHTVLAVAIALLAVITTSFEVFYIYRRINSYR